MKIELNWQKRAVILLSASLALLSVVLAVMAIREAERERLFSQRQAEEEQRRAAATVSAQADSLISRLENAVFNAWLAGRDQLVPGNPDQAANLIRESPSEGALIGDIFLLDAAGKAVFPAARPLYLFADEKPPRQEIPPEIETGESWKEAENAEFKLGDWAQAAEAYQKLLIAPSVSRFKPFLLSRLGRCYQRAGELPQALAVFEQVLKTSGREQASGGIPLGLIAALQVGDINLKLKQPKEAAGAYADLYENLLNGTWGLTESQFEFYLKTAKDQFQKIKGQAPSLDLDGRWRLLGEREETARRKMTHLGSLRQRIIPLVLSNWGETGNGPNRFHRFSAAAGEDLLLASCRLLDGATIFGLTFDPKLLAERILSANMEKEGQGEGRIIRLTDESGRFVAGEDFAASGRPGTAPQLVYTGSFDNDFPPWTVAIFRVGPDPSLRAFYLRRNFYILLVAVVMAALFLGGYLAIRSTGKELQLAKLKSDFVSTVSHEFRTPLTSIRYLAELLERGRVRDEEKKQRYFKTISSESERLSRLVENILDFSRIEAGMKEYRLGKADFASLARDVAGRFLDQAAFKGVTLKTEISDPLPEMRADREAISRAVFNLLDNAAKYSGENPEILFRVWLDGEDVCLEIADNGVGIPVADQKKVFEKFYRAETAIARNIKGSGIGLTLVAHIVKAHGGKISLESEPGKGTRVTLRLPVRPAEG